MECAPEKTRQKTSLVRLIDISCSRRNSALREMHVVVFYIFSDKSFIRALLLLLPSIVPSSEW
jgi:hypothetical protein